MKNRETIKKVLAVLTVVLLAVCQILPFLSIIGITMVSVEVKGCFFVLVAACVFLYSVISGNLRSYFISAIGMALGYSWTFYHVYRSYRTMHDMTTEFGLSSLMEFEIGFYVYVLSCVLLVVCLLIKNTKKEDRVLRTGPTVQQGMTMPCLIGFYRSGMLGNASLINHSCSITLDQVGTLQVMIANQQVYRYEIQSTQIQGIYCYSGRGLLNMASYQTERSLLASALVGRWGPTIAQNIGPCNDSPVSYIVEIHYLEGNEVRKAVFEFADNPDFFFQRYQNRYQKVSQG